MNTHSFKKALTAVAASVALFLAPTEAQACTSFLVGKNASADGSAFITYNQDDYGMFGRLHYLPAAQHAKGEMRKIYDGDTNHYHGEIAEAPYTYAVMGYINEHQVGITETTFGGRSELEDPKGIIDYVSLMTIALQRSKTAREAIRVMTSLVQEYGYASEGESFSIADPNEVWILEMIGKGPKEKGAVWVAIRIPDDCIACHANQSRIHQFNMKDKKNVMYAKDVISFARKKGYFTGKDADFSFADAYAPADFSTIRFCETRVWSFYNKWVNGMERYLDYVDGKHIGQAKPMPLYFKPKQKLSLQDVMNSMRDHYEGTPFDITKDVGAGPYEAPYRPTPLVWEHKGKKYFNERPISTQQTAGTYVIQLRASLPNAIGGVLWYGNDDPNMVAYTPVYCCASKAPECYDPKDASDVKFSWNSAFWVENWVSNMTYPRYSQLFPSVKAAREELESKYASQQAEIEAQAKTLLSQDPARAKAYLTDYSAQCAKQMMNRWKQLGEYLIVKFNDQAIKPEKDGKYEMTPDGLGKAVERPGFNENYREVITKETGDKYLIPSSK
ncbi:MAG: C69 family dipeptidase [Prevotellamassilia sp.]|nr:C69 family dipeptidase [Prevotellamassilia sp.]